MSTIFTNPELAFARVEFTSFEHPGRAYWKLTPVHVVKEWQWPGDRAKDQTPLWRTARISEWRWPMRTTYNCDEKPAYDHGAAFDCDFKPSEAAVANDGWPDPGVRTSTRALVDAGLLLPWQWFPVIDCAPTFTMDAKGYQVAARGYSGPNDGLPEDYLEFWLDEESHLTDEVENAVAG